MTNALLFFHLLGALAFVAGAGMLAIVVLMVWKPG